MSETPIKEIVEKIINDNYAVFLAFDVTDGNLSFKDYCKQLAERRLHQ